MYGRFHVHVYPVNYSHQLPGPDCDVDAAAHHITTMFSSCSRTPDKPLYHHYTTATDNVNAQVVFDMVIDQVIKENLSATQLLWLLTELIYLFSKQSTKVTF